MCSELENLGREVACCPALEAGTFYELKLVGLLETITSSSHLKVRNELSISFETKEGEEKLYPDGRSNLGREVTCFPAL
jgi:hypothetical protein